MPKVGRPCPDRRSVEVEDEFGRELGKRSDETPKNDRMHRPGTHPMVLPILQPTQRRTRVQFTVTLGSGFAAT